MLSPKRVRYRKMQRGRNKGKSQRGARVSFGEYGIKAVTPGMLTARQIEAARRSLSRHLKRSGKLWIRIFPDIPYTKKPAETRMGSGKGSPEYWITKIKPGRILFEIGGVQEESARHALRLAAFKLPVKTTFVKKEAL